MKLLANSMRLINLKKFLLKTPQQDREFSVSDTDCMTVFQNLNIYLITPLHDEICPKLHKKNKANHGSISH